MDIVCALKVMKIYMSSSFFTVHMAYLTFKQAIYIYKNIV